MKKKESIFELMEVMARLRSHEGCPWDREQDHLSLRYHAVEEVYELIDAIESGDDLEMAEELGDLLLQVVFHCQLAAERQAFDFKTVCRRIVDKLIRRHPHVFGESKIRTVAGVWAQWEHIKRAEKSGTRHERPSALDGIPRHLPALQRAEKLAKKARKAGLPAPPLKAQVDTRFRPRSPAALGRELFALAEYAQQRGWSAENALRAEIKKKETRWRRQEFNRVSKKEKSRSRRA
jgi:MazG family protein